MPALDYEPNGIAELRRSRRNRRATLSDGQSPPAAGQECVTATHAKRGEVEDVPENAEVLAIVTAASGEC